MQEGKLVWPKELPPVGNFIVVAAVTSVEQETTHVDHYHVKGIAYRWELRRCGSRQNLLTDLPLGSYDLSDFAAVWITSRGHQKSFGELPDFSGSSSCRLACPNAD